MNTQFDSLHFSIEKLLPQGFFILAGSGKIGKSIAYICNPNKTENCTFVYSENSFPKTASVEFSFYLRKAKSFEKFSAVLMQEYGIEVKEIWADTAILRRNEPNPSQPGSWERTLTRPPSLPFLLKTPPEPLKQRKTDLEYPDSITSRLQRHKAAINAHTPDTIQSMVDIQKKLSEGKGTSYEKWAKIHNLNQAAKTVNFLSEHGFSSPEELETALNEAATALDAAGLSLKELERRICGNR